MHQGHELVAARSASAFPLNGSVGCWLDMKWVLKTALMDAEISKEFLPVSLVTADNVSLSPAHEA